MLAESKAIASEMARRTSPRWLSLLGTAGAGKTHLAKKILAYWRHKAGWRVIQGRAGNVQSLLDSKFISWRAFVDRQRQGNFSEISDLRNIPLLVIDDIGAEYDPTGFAKSRLDDLIDSRLGKWTVITSNLSLEQIAKQLDTRIASRMLRAGSRVITENVTDYNRRTHAKNA